MVTDKRVIAKHLSRAFLVVYFATFFIATTVSIVKKKLLALKGRPFTDGETAALRR